MAFSTAGHARQTVTIIYPFPNESITNIYRSLAAEANRSQDKYHFIVDVKPGAGGSIASNHVLATPHTILAHTTAFFVRPNVYPKESHDLKNFRLQYVLCTMPMAVTSTRFRTWNDISKTESLTIGTSGLGVTSHLIMLALAQTYPNLHVVPFKSTNEALLGLLSGNIDLQIGLLSEAEQWRNVNVLGITGAQPVGRYRPLSAMGLNRDLANMTLVIHLTVPAKNSDAQTQEFYQIFDRASQTAAVRGAMSNDTCVPTNVTLDSLEPFYNLQVQNWRRYSDRVRIN